jgi:hypothetical protein
MAQVGADAQTAACFLTKPPESCKIPSRPQQTEARPNASLHPRRASLLHSVPRHSLQQHFHPELFNMVHCAFVPRPIHPILV